MREQTVRTLVDNDMGLIEISEITKVVDKENVDTLYNFTQYHKKYNKDTYSYDNIEAFFKQQIGISDITEITENVDGSISVFVVYNGKVGIGYTLEQGRGYVHPILIPNKVLEYYKTKGNYSDSNTLELDISTLYDIKDGLEEL